MSVQPKPTNALARKRVDTHFNKEMKPKGRYNTLVGGLKTLNRLRKELKGRWNIVQTLSLFLHPANESVSPVCSLLIGRIHSPVGSVTTGEQMTASGAASAWTN